MKGGAFSWIAAFSVLVLGIYLLTSNLRPMDNIPNYIDRSAISMSRVTQKEHVVPGKETGRGLVMSSFCRLDAPTPFSDKATTLQLINLLSWINLRGYEFMPVPFDIAERTPKGWNKCSSLQFHSKGGCIRA